MTCIDVIYRITHIMTVAGYAACAGEDTSLTWQYQALTTPLGRLPGIARNDRRATVFVGRSCPPNLYFENSGNKRFLHQTSAHRTPYALLILWGNLQSDYQGQSISVRDLNDLISIVFNLIIWSVRYYTLIWIINDIMQIRLQYLEW